MRHYEIVLVIHPDYGNQDFNVITYYTDMVTVSGGKVHRMENWGCRQLAYSIKRLSKAFYVLLNIEINKHILDKLTSDFKFNEMVLRSIVIRMKHAVVDTSPMFDKKEDKTNSGVSELF